MPGNNVTITPRIITKLGTMVNRHPTIANEQNKPGSVFGRDEILLRTDLTPPGDHAAE